MRRPRSPAQVHEAIDRLAADLATPAHLWRLQYRFFNSGLLAFRPDQLDLRLAERYLVWREGLDERYKTGIAATWFGDWTPEQTCYMAMFALAHPPAGPLDEEYHLGGEMGHAFNYFLRHYLVREATLTHLRALVREL